MKTRRLHWYQLVLTILLFTRVFVAHADSQTLLVDSNVGTINTDALCPTPRYAEIYRTIQGAIDCAAPGDIIEIAPGTYAENITINKHLTLQGDLASTTVVDGGGIARTLSIVGPVNVIIHDLTIMNGSAANGAGIFTSTGTLTITNSIIRLNIAADSGGGIFSQAGTVTLLYSQLFDNTAEAGGGIFTQGGTVNLRGTVVSGNRAIGAGGGIYTQAGSLKGDGSITGNVAGIDHDIYTVVGAVTLTEIQDSIINARVVLQGRPEPPHTRWSVPLFVTITLEGSVTPVFNDTVTTDQTGLFSLFGLAPGNYQIRIKHSHSLSNLRTVTLISGVNAIELGTLREGDTDGSNLVNLTDFSLLVATFNKQVGDVDYDERADFNEDEIIDILDFDLLVPNFGQNGD